MTIRDKVHQRLGLVMEAKRTLKDFQKDPYGIPIFIDMKLKDPNRQALAKFSLKPDTLKIMRSYWDYDGFSKAFIKIHGHDFDEYSGWFNMGIQNGYQQDPRKYVPYVFSSSQKEELETEGYDLDMAADFVSEGVRLGRLIREAHEWYLAWGDWDTYKDKYLQVYQSHQWR